LLYNILFTAGFLLAAPYYFWRMRRRGNWRTGFEQRFGRFDAKLKQAITNRQTIWLHAVSVGEVNICTNLIRALEPRIPNVKIIVSTTTTTGMARLRELLPTHISRIYYPIDRKKFVARALAAFHPEAIILVEAEIWPNFIWRAKSLNIPTFLVNARMSERSYPRYKRYRLLFRQLFASFQGVGAQNEEDAAKLIALGCRPEAVRVVGSLKFDAARISERRRVDVPGILASAGYKSGGPILVAGSTHAGEEGILADIYQRLRTRFPDLFLVLVPRHHERSREIGRELSARGVKFVYRSDVAPGRPSHNGHADCLVVNTIGELRHFYEVATVVFVGKSLTANGGQNPIEPGESGRAIVFGPNMQNFGDITRLFLQNNAAVQVADAAGLEHELSHLLGNPQRREELGTRARTVVIENLGAIERTVDMIVPFLRDRGLYVADRE
jgi:3-deoxy-D-manno-octulosonic-acid transferase